MYHRFASLVTIKKKEKKKKGGYLEMGAHVCMVTLLSKVPYIYNPAIAEV